MAAGRATVGFVAVGVGAASGAVAGLVAVLVAGGTGANPVIGLMAGLVVGALGGLAAGWVGAGAESGTRPAPGTGDGPVDPTDARPQAAPSTAAPAAPVPANLGPLVTSIGNRYRGLADRQLGALQALGAATRAGGEDGAGSRAEVVATRAQAVRLGRRMRRLAKTLEVLADDPDGRESARPASMGDVIAAAIADNDEHERVDATSLHPAIVDGNAVPDLVHLLAELIDNAVAASAGSDTKVVVVGRRSAEGYLLSVVDEGRGMAKAERGTANQQLSSPPPLPRQSATAFGLPTVGRLAERHGVAVQLLEAATDGLIAKVRVPARLLEGSKASAATPPSVKAKTPGKAPAPTPAAASPAAGVIDADSILDLRDTSAPANGPGTGDATPERLRRSMAGFAPSDRTGTERAEGADSTTGAAAGTATSADASERAEAARRMVRRSKPADSPRGREPRPGGERRP